MFPSRLPGVSVCCFQKKTEKSLLGKLCRKSGCGLMNPPSNCRAANLQPACLVTEATASHRLLHQPQQQMHIVRCHSILMPQHTCLTPSPSPNSSCSTSTSTTLTGLSFSLPPAYPTHAGQRGELRRCGPQARSAPAMAVAMQQCHGTTPGHSSSTNWCNHVLSSKGSTVTCFSWSSNGARLVAGASTGALMLWKAGGELICIPVGFWQGGP